MNDVRVRAPLCHSNYILTTHRSERREYIFFQGLSSGDWLVQIPMGTAVADFGCRILLFNIATPIHVLCVLLPGLSVEYTHFEHTQVGDEHEEGSQLQLY